MITIVDYGMGNLRSVHNALELLGAEVCISGHPDDILAAERLILPGVGAFGLAMKHLHERGIAEALTQKIMVEKAPLLAICLGMELLMEESFEHGHHKGLGWLPGHVKLFEVDDLRVPHVGWNEIRVQGEAPLFKDLGPYKEFYFVHSYHVVTNDESVIAATTPYGYDFVSALYKDNIFAAQFHPEKSQAIGLQVLRNFMQWQPMAVAV